MLSAGLTVSTPSIEDAEAEVAPGHNHRWRIAEQGGPKSAGQCACGAERDFENAWHVNRELVMHSRTWRFGSRGGHTAP